MMEGENIVQYCKRIKEVVNAIQGANGTLEDEKVLRKVLRTLIPVMSLGFQQYQNCDALQVTI